MFSIFTKKVMNEELAKEFWLWFEEKEDWIKECISNGNIEFIGEIDKRLKPIFPYFKKELEFLLGYNDGIGEFYFYHFYNKDLMRDGEKLKALMPSSIASKWKFILEE